MGWRSVSSNLTLKLIALAMAVTLALFLRSESHTTIVGYVVPVEIRNLPKTKVLVRPAKPDAQVRMRGPWFVLAQLASSPPVFRISVPESLGPSHRVSLEVQDLSLPSRIEVLSIEPSTLELHFDELATRSVPVVVPRIHVLPPDLQMKGVAVEPMEIQLSGPQASLAALSAIESEPIDISQVSRSGSLTLSLRIPTWATQASHHQVTANVTVAVVEAERVFERLPIEVRNSSGAPLSVAPSSVRVVAVGEKSRIDALAPGAIIPYVRIHAAPKSGERFPVQVEPREGVARFEVSPPEVRSASDKTISVKKPVEKR